MLKPSPAVGATLIVAGTTIGAGMLALPIISHGLGFPLMAGLMLITWAFMAVAALLSLEVNLAVKPGCSLFVMATETLGGVGRLLAVGAMVFLFYALLAAYIAGGGSQFGQYLSQAVVLNGSTDIPGMVLFTLTFGTLASIGVRSVDLCNRLLFFLMLLTFLISLGLLAPSVEISRLESIPDSPWYGLAVLPIIFTSFGYHGSIPSLIAYVGPNRKVLRTVFFLGSFVPLFIYLLWLALTLGQLDNHALSQISDSGSVSSLVQALSSQHHSSGFSGAIYLFADLALVTSFLGVALGLFDFVHSATGSRSRFKTALVVYLPPLGIAILLPGAFVVALSYAALALAVLAILLPALMVQKLIRQKVLERTPQPYLFWPVVLFGVMICALSLIYS